MLVPRTFDERESRTERYENDVSQAVQTDGSDYSERNSSPHLEKGAEMMFDAILEGLLLYWLIGGLGDDD